MIRLAIALILISGAAIAADAPHEIDFTQVLKSLTDDDLTNVGPDGNTKVPLTLGGAAAIALEQMTDDDRNIDPKVKFDRDQLARKVYKNAHAVLSPDDIATIKQRIGKVYGPSVIGAAWPILDPTLAKDSNK